MKRIKSFYNFINESYKVNNITEDDIISCIKAGGVIYSDIVSDYPGNKDWKTEALTPVDIENGKVMVDIGGNPHYVKLENVRRIEWNEDKRMSELFDSEELKSKEEIEFLKGGIDKKSMVSNVAKNTMPEMLKGKLYWDVPYLRKLKTFGSEKQLYLKMDDMINISTDNIVTFMLEIIVRDAEKQGEYTLMYKMETINNGKSVFRKLDEFENLDYNKLKDVLNGELLQKVIDWNEHSQKTFNKTPFPNVPKSLLNLNQRYN